MTFLEYIYFHYYIVLILPSTHSFTQYLIYQALTHLYNAYYMPGFNFVLWMQIKKKKKKDDLRHGSCPQGAHNILWETDNYDKM